MRPIPNKLRQALADDPFMSKCVYGCTKRPEYEHCWTFVGKQINEHWAIIPVCEYHHRGKGLNKHYNQYISLKRAFENPEWKENMLTKYGRLNWESQWKWLKSKFEFTV